ncbi:bifunctional RecF-RecN-SMC [Babesia duncani]|uniref:Structural maintenance of chromosomes protein n=1 Tax=Babesia duncani TaxID=323732 RepID=A0AAD9PN47_9APIC|nr:bifunctional RecF-RecN-SMC [Babesia duncani]
MYIKYVRLKGFCTYRDLCVFTFSPGYNAIVGLNGSGKSNVLLAISFVLAENMEHFDRTSYLYKGGLDLDDDFTAQVEVIFDISREHHLTAMLETGSELCLKRIFSKSKNVYMVNGKQMTCKEYRQYLTSANLVQYSNNTIAYKNDLHFIVKQGMVGNICNMTFEERLNAFRNVIGHCSFDAKIQDSLKLLQNSKLVYNSLENQMKQISRKLETLDLAKDEMDQWQQLDKQRQCLVANLVLLKLEQLSSAIDLKRSEQAHQTAVVQEMQEQLNSLQATLIDKTRACDALEPNPEAIDPQAQWQQMEQQAKELECEIKEIRHEIAQVEYTRDQHDQELRDLLEFIQDANAQLRAIESQDMALQAEISAIQAQVNELLHASPMVKTKQVLKLQTQRQALKLEMQQHHDTVQQLEKSLTRCSSDLDLVARDLEAAEQELEGINDELKRWNKEIESITEVQRNLQKQLASEMAHFANLKLDQSEANFKKLAFSNVHSMQLVDSWLASPEGLLNREYYIGVLIDIIKVKDEYSVAIEQVLGQRLFTIIVSNIGCAKSIIKFAEQSQNKYATIRIAALDIIPPVTSLAQDSGKRALPLVKLIQYQQELIPLMHQFLGDFRLVPDPDAASKLTSQQLNCVTPDGQIFYHRGIVSGGFVSMTDSLLRTYKRYKEMRAACDATAQTVEQLKGELQAQVARQDAIKAERDRAMARRQAALERAHALALSHLELKSYKESILGRLGQDGSARLAQALAALEEQICLLETRQEGAPDAPETDTSHTGPAMAALNLKLQELTRSRQDKQAQYQEMKDTINRKNAERNEISKQMITDLQLLGDYRAHLKQLQEKHSQTLLAKNNFLSLSAHRTSLDKALEQERLESMQAQRTAEKDCVLIETQLTQARAALDTLTQSLGALALSKRQAEQEFEKIDTSIIEQARQMYSSDRQQVLTRLGELNLKCARMDLSSRLSISDCNAIRADFEGLATRKTAASRASAAITRSIQALETEKEYNLVRMLHKLNDKISQVFQQLVPQGRIKVLLLKKNRAAQATEAVLPEYCDIDPMDHFTGLDICVSFKKTQNLEPLHQLSGGQKTLVSLAFILAAQRLQVAPFYLFDEIDAALDETFRSRVAKLLHKQCQEGSQCIVTTFKEQLLGPADVIYEIHSENGASVAARVGLERATAALLQPPALAQPR